MSGWIERLYAASPTFLQQIGAHVYGWRRVRRLGGVFERVVHEYVEREGWSPASMGAFVTDQLRSQLRHRVRGGRLLSGHLRGVGSTRAPSGGSHRMSSRGSRSSRSPSSAALRKPCSPSRPCDGLPLSSTQAARLAHPSVSTATAQPFSMSLPRRGPLVPVGRRELQTATLGDRRPADRSKGPGSSAFLAL